MMQWLKALKIFYFKLKQWRNRVMTQEDKQLLFKDLCARLPYRTMVKCITDGNHEFDEELSVMHIMNFYQFVVKPYLRPMSSMTEEEMDEVEMIMGVEDNKSIIFDFTSDGNIIFKNGNCSVCVFKKLIDFLYSCHFDFNNLIEKGLAIEITEENNPYK